MGLNTRPKEGRWGRVKSTFANRFLWMTKNYNAGLIFFRYIWVEMPRKTNGLFDVLILLFLAAYCGQL